jgi:hypothetical protein
MSYLILVSVLKRNQLGIGLFCFCFFPRIRFTLKDLLEGYNIKPNGISTSYHTSCNTKMESDIIGVYGIPIEDNNRHRKSEKGIRVLS